MAKVFDEENVHDFWGLSPAIDALDMLEQLPVTASQHSVHEMLTNSEAINVLQEAPEILARHMLLLSVLLDSSLPVRQRTEMFIELHGNALLQQTTADYLEKMGRLMENMTLQYSSKDMSATDYALTDLFDLSLLRFQQRDDIAESFRKYGNKTSYDMQKAWEACSRKFYGSRYDHKRNAIDWDYHMRLTPQSKNGIDPVTGSIIHFYHFRRWRESGVAYELRDCKYNQPNRSLLSTAYGKRKEYKDRLGNDHGRSISTWGFWGDILNSPYHSFGTACEEKSLFKISNKQHTHTAIDVAEYNVKAIIEELRTGKPYKLPQEGFVRSKLNTGPTSMEDLEHMATQAEAATQATTSSSVAASSEPVTSSAATAPSAASTEASAEATPADPSLQAHETQTQSPAEQGTSREQSRDAPPALHQEPGTEQQKPAAIDAAMLESCSRVKIHLLTGDLRKLLLSRSKYAGMFCAMLIGHRHAHLVDKEHDLLRLACPGGALAVESVKNMLQLSSKQVESITDAIHAKACAAGWQPWQASEAVHSDAQLCFTAPA